MEQREQAVNKHQSAVDKRANEIEKMHEQEMVELQRVAQMNVDEARIILLAEVEKDARNDMARIIRQIESEAREEGDKRARKLIADSIQRVATEQVAEFTTSLVPLPNEEMKGRIVGRNGRNIRAFEQAAGVDVIVDDTPEAVTISCFEPVRREVARRSLARLILDGRIHPAHIEKVLEEEQKAVDKVIVEAGEQAAFDAGVTGLHPEVLRMMGRLKFRTSYGQNQLAHAVEVAKLSGILAAELGANEDVCRQGGFLHDLGKAMDHNQEGTHALLGAEFAKRYGVNPSGGQCHCCSSPRGGAGERGSHYHRICRCDLWCPSRRTPRRPGSLHQAHPHPGGYGHRLQGRLARLTPSRPDARSALSSARKR